MSGEEKPSIKYRIKSYHYDVIASGSPQLLFTIEEVGIAGELRQYAHEISFHKDWQSSFSADDVARIQYALDALYAGP